MKDDPIVREVRRNRAALLREAGGTLAKLFEKIREWEKADKDHTFVDFSKDARRKNALRPKSKRAKTKRKRAKR